MEEEFEEVAKFFKADEWNETASYEKLRYQTMFNNYKDMIKSGFNVPKPYFMNTEEEDKPKIDEVADMEKKFKRKCVVESGVRKRTKREEAAAIVKRYPKRNIPAKNYVEEAEIPEDRYVYCDECMYEHLDSCKEHKLIPVHDNPVPVDKNNPNRARDTVPPGWVKVKESKIINGGYGIWAVCKIPKGIQFGPYEGETGGYHTDGLYSWQIKKNGRVIDYIDGFDTSTSNWMRYVNCARNRKEQNLMAFQYRGQIFYRSVVDIQPHTELLVFYGPKFAKELGIDVKNYNSPPSNPFPEKVFKCETCYLVFRSPIYLEEHLSRCTDKYVATEDSDDVISGKYID
ncbi:Blimp-1 [Carabus blaptoides fortunei]